MSDKIERERWGNLEGSGRTHGVDKLLRRKNWKLGKRWANGRVDGDRKDHGFRCGMI